MPKKKRTRKQKVQGDLRYHQSHNITQPPEQQETSQYSVADITVSSPIAPKVHTLSHTINTQGYGYLRGDLLKTTILTTAIVTLEILAYYLTKTS